MSDAEALHTTRVTEPRPITIHAGEQAVISAALAAKRYGVSNSTMRGTLTRLRGDGIIEPVPETLDERTPLYPLAELDLAIKTRPGRGSNRKRTEERPMAKLTTAMHPAAAAARTQLESSGWSEDATERATREVASELWRTRKEAGHGWRQKLRKLADEPDARNEYAGHLMASLRAQGAKEVTPLPIARAIQFAVQAMTGARNVEEAGQ